MDLQQLVTGILAGTTAPESSPTEADYHAAWLDHRVGEEDEFMTAALGGALADRLAWVFVAGYQASMRRSFPALPRENGWCAFVNTEDRTGTYPGTTLTGEPGNHRLSGWKGWVAAADHIDHLIVTASHNQRPFMLMRRDQPGVRIVSGGPPKAYLSELVQGRAHFDNVAISETQIIGDARTFPVFRSAESAYVRTALSAFMFSHARRLGAPPALIGGALDALFACAAILQLPLPSDTAAVAMLGSASHVVALALEFESLIAQKDQALHQLWVKDRRLIRGSLPGIASRAERALGIASVDASAKT